MWCMRFTSDIEILKFNKDSDAYGERSVVRSTLLWGIVFWRPKV